MYRRAVMKAFTGTIWRNNVVRALAANSFRAELPRALEPTGRKHNIDVPKFCTNRGAVAVLSVILTTHCDAMLPLLLPYAVW